MLYDRLSNAQLLRELITAAAKVGMHAEKEPYDAERELYADPHMYEVREIKEAILKRLEAAEKPAEGEAHEAPHKEEHVEAQQMFPAGSPLPESGLNLSQIEGHEF